MGAWQEIVDYTVPSNTTSVTLNNFGTITKDDFIKVVATFIDSGSAENNLFWFPNGNTTQTNYHIQRLRASGSTVDAFRGNEALFGNFSPTGDVRIVYAKLSENDRFNWWLSNNVFTDSSVQTNFWVGTSSGATFTSGITSFTFQSLPPSGNRILANSRIQIYKLTAEKVAEITLTSTQERIDITGLDIKKGDEYLLVSDINSISAIQGVNLFANNNTTPTNYYMQRILGDGSSATALRDNRPLYTITSGTRSLNYIHIKLSNIGSFTFQSYGIRSYGTSTPILENVFGSSTAENITSINQLTIFSTGASNHNITTGTRFELYKLYEGGN